MPNTHQLLFTRPDPLSLQDQAALGPMQQPARSQFAHLLRHFLERFFNHETASPEGDAKARLVLIACATGLPGFVIALYLWPVYHPWSGIAPPYWLQVNHHFFYVVYSMVVMGIIAVFEWDLFFPDLLDLFVLKSLPVQDRTVFQARVAAISVFVIGFLFDANVLAPLVLPAATDPPSVSRFLLGHMLAVGASGLFAALLVLAMQSTLLALVGDRLFRKLSLFLQGLIISALVMLLLLFPTLSGIVPLCLESGSVYVLCFPPFWFLGIYQCLLEGASALPVYARLAQCGFVAVGLTAAVVLLTYPLAYLRKVRALAEGPGTHSRRSRIYLPFKRLIHSTIARNPQRRAVFHFLGETLLRVQRYRIYLVLYGGVGISIVATTLLRITVVHQQVRCAVTTDGILASLGIVVFWVIAGLHVAFASPGNRQGSWVFRVVHGRPVPFQTAMEQHNAVRVWVLPAGFLVSMIACFTARFIAPPELLTGPSTCAEMLVAAGMCLLLTDILYLNVTTVGLTGEPDGAPSNMAITVAKYFIAIPVFAWLPVVAEPWIAADISHSLVTVAAVAAVHWALERRHRGIVQEHCNRRALEDDEEEFPLKLGLRG